MKRFIILSTLLLALPVLAQQSPISNPGSSGSGSSGALTPGVTTITGGTPGKVEFNNGGVLGEENILPSTPSTNVYVGTGAANVAAAAAPSSLVFTTGTLSLGGNLTASGAYSWGFVVPGAYTYTLPSATGTLASLAGGTYTGKITTVASASGGSGFNLPAGAAPSAPANGDIWTTIAGLFAQINGVTVGPYGTGGGAGGLLAANNLSDVASVQTSRVNLKIDQRTAYAADSNQIISAASRYIVTTTAFTAQRTFTLPAASALNAGEPLLIKDEGSINGSNTLLIAVNGVDTIDGNSSFTLLIARSALGLISNGVNGWEIDINLTLAGATCTTGQFVSAISANGGITCSSPSGGGGSAFHPGFQPGQFYSFPGWSSGGGFLVSANRLYAIPFYNPNSSTTTFTKESVYVNTGVTSTACELGLYANNAGIPGTLILDAGNVATTVSSTNAELTGISLSIPSGWSWLVVGCNGASNLQGTSSSTASPLSWLIGTTLQAGVTQLYGAWTYSVGGLPGTFPTVVYNGGVGQPLVYVRL